MDKRLRGLLAGLAATGPMTAVMAAGRAAGWLGTPPPEEISGRLAARIDVRDEFSPPTFDVAWFANHLAFGAFCGALYASLRGVLTPASPVAGIEFGFAVWAVSYGGVMPALGLYPSPRRDEPSRIAVMLVAHVVYGVALAESYRLSAERRSS
jgi:hypothetical protein